MKWFGVQSSADQELISALDPSWALLHADELGNPILGSAGVREDKGALLLYSSAGLSHGPAHLEQPVFSPYVASVLASGYLWAAAAFWHIVFFLRISFFPTVHWNSHVGMPSKQGTVSGARLQLLDSKHVLVQDGLIANLRCRPHNLFYTIQCSCPAKRSLSSWIWSCSGVPAGEAPGEVNRIAPAVNQHVHHGRLGPNHLKFIINIFSCIWNKTLDRDLPSLVPSQQYLNFGIACVNHWEKWEKHLQASKQTPGAADWWQQMLGDGTADNTRSCTSPRPLCHHRHLPTLALCWHVWTLGRCAKIEAAAPQKLSLWSNIPL